jgi:hypothetical protein
MGRLVPGLFKRARPLAGNELAVQTRKLDTTHGCVIWDSEYWLAPRSGAKRRQRHPPGDA